MTNINLNEKQQAILSFLIDLHAATQKGTVKSDAQLLKKHGLSPAHSVVAKTMGIYNKVNKTLVYNTNFSPSNSLAIEIDENVKLYNNFAQKSTDIKRYMDGEVTKSKFPIPFKEVWIFMGYSEYSKAKRFLTQNFTENQDYLFFATNGEKYNENTGATADRGRPEENIYLTDRCFVEFCQNAGTPMAKYFRKRITDFVFEVKDQYKKHFEERKLVNKEAIKADDLQEAITILNNLQKNITGSVHDRITKNVRQLTFEFFDEFMYWDQLKSVADKVYELIMKGKPVQLKLNANTNEERLQLPESGQAGSSAS